MDQTDLQVVTYTDIMSPDTLTDYWVSWEDHVIEFGVGRARDPQYTVISQSDSTYTVTSVGLAVDQTYDVDWQIFTENGQQAYLLFFLLCLGYFHNYQHVSSACCGWDAGQIGQIIIFYVSSH